MILVTVLLVLGFIGGVVGAFLAAEKHYTLTEVFSIAAIVFGLALLLHTPIALLSRVGQRVSIKEYQAFVATINKARERGADIESAAIQMKIAEWNQALASYRYWNEGWTDTYVVDEIAELPFIE